MENEIKGISCEVKNCKYHDNANNCLAGHIHVGDRSATTRHDTACETFEKCDSCGCK